MRQRLLAVINLESWDVVSADHLPLSEGKNKPVSHKTTSNLNDDVDSHVSDRERMRDPNNDLDDASNSAGKQTPDISSQPSQRRKRKSKSGVKVEIVEILDPILNFHLLITCIHDSNSSAIAVYLLILVGS